MGLFTQGGGGSNLPTTAKIDEFMVFNYTLNQDEIQSLLTEGYNPIPATPPSDGMLLTLLSPTQHYGINTSILEGWNHMVWINASVNKTTASIHLNSTNWTLSSENGTAWFFLNNSHLENRDYQINISANDTSISANLSLVLNFTFDTVPPSIAPVVLLSNNKTFVANGTLSTQINFTDDQEIYSVNVTFADGTTLYYGTNLGQNNYQLNISQTVDSTINNWLDIKVCDAHTAFEISPIKRIDTYNKGLKYVVQDNPFLMQDKWVSIYPKLSSDYLNTPKTDKFKDRYTFTFSKDKKLEATETFIVESTDYIDIAKMQKYKGHLIIPSLNRWIDFENGESTKTDIKRITDTKVEVTIYGLKSKEITFNSIGELNCVSDRLYFGNLNPVQRYTQYVLAANTTNFYLNVTQPTMLTSISAKLWYNNTYYALGTEPNYTQSVTVPVVTGNSSNKTFNFVITANGIEYNTTYLQQNISNWFLDGCDSYTTKAINFTLKNELNGSEVLGSMTGSIFYSVGSTTKTFSFTPSNVYNQQICVFPDTAVFDSDYYVYYSGSDYPQRRYYANDTTIDTTMDTIPLYLLQTAYGIYIRFQVVDSSETSLSGVQVTAKTTVSGSLVTVEQENTDDSGLATFFLNPDVDYTFTFVKTGYTTTSFSLRPTSSEIYYVTMGSGLSSGTTQPSGSGISYSFTPSNVELQNATNYTFSFSLTSEYWEVTACTLYLKNSSQTLTSGSTSWDTDSCDISFSYNTGNQTSLYLLVSYQVNSTNVNVTKSYSVSYSYEGSFSLKNFIDDLTSFSEAGFNDFTRMIIALIVIMGLVGLASVKMSIREPEPLIFMFLALVFIFSMVGWLYIDNPAIKFEILRKFGIFTLLGLIGGAYLVKRFAE